MMALNGHILCDWQSHIQDCNLTCGPQYKLEWFNMHLVPVAVIVEFVSAVQKTFLRSPLGAQETICLICLPWSFYRWSKGERSHWCKLGRMDQPQLKVLSSSLFPDIASSTFGPVHHLISTTWLASRHSLFLFTYWCLSFFSLLFLHYLLYLQCASLWIRVWSGQLSSTGTLDVIVNYCIFPLRCFNSPDLAMEAEDLNIIGRQAWSCFKWSLWMWACAVHRC